MDHRDSSPSPRALERQATAFLRRHGFTYAGRPRREVDPDQSAFERRAVCTPTGGLPGRRRKRKVA